MIEEKKQNLNNLIEEIEELLKSKYNIKQKYQELSSSSYDWFTSFIFCVMPNINEAKEFLQKWSTIEISIMLWSFSYNLSISKQDVFYPIIYYTLCNYVEILLDKELPALSALLKLNDIILINV